MRIEAANPAEYIDQCPEDRQPVIERLRNLINDNLPQGFEETMTYGMIGWVVPYSIYPDGYHCKPKQPLPFMNLANQKNFVAVYHMGIYSDSELMDWFTSEFPKHAKRKLDMGKSCIRFKKMDDIPYELIGQLCTKISVEKWIDLYEAAWKK